MEGGWKIGGFEGGRETDPCGVSDLGSWVGEDSSSDLTSRTQAVRSGLLGRWSEGDGKTGIESAGWLAA